MSTPKNRGGRPPLAAEDLRHARKIKISDREWAILAAAAAADGQPVSAWIRERALAAAEARGVRSMENEE